MGCIQLYDFKGSGMDVECLFRGFNDKYDIVAKIWSKSSILKNSFFNDIGTNGEDYCHLNFKYPMCRFKKENYIKTKNITQRIRINLLNY